MEIHVWTWGTGAAFGRELGVPPSRTRRHQCSTSIIGQEGADTKFHFLVDAGSPCVEGMVDREVAIPDVLFITHPHSDHCSDLDKLANNRLRSLSFLQEPLAPLTVIGSQECLEHPEMGLKSKFDYLGAIVKWVPIRSYDVWYHIRKDDSFILPSRTLSDYTFVFPLAFKALPVYHAFAPGACLFIFTVWDQLKKIVISGDFESIEDSISENPDLKDADLYLIDSNTIKATGANHSNWMQNKYLIHRWITGQKKARVLLHHIGGFEDYSHGYYDHLPNDEDWMDEIKTFDPPKGTNVELAQDNSCYEL